MIPTRVFPTLGRTRFALTIFLGLLCLWLPVGARAQNPEVLRDRPISEQSNESLVRGLTCLMNLQSEDGGWHSQQYGSLKQGAAMTTLVLYAVSNVPAEFREPHAKRINDAFGFLQTGLAKSGFVTNVEGSQDYPVYCTAMLLVASEKLELKLEEKTRLRMLDYLLQSQVSESRGFSKDHLEYGGWDVLGPDTQDGKTSGTNVSVTCYVTEALSLFRSDNQAQTSLAMAEDWLDKIIEGSQDGGLFFTPKLDSMNNKAQWSDGEFQQPKSYGTATSDGLQIMNHCGVQAGQTKRIAATTWLADHSDPGNVPGFGDDDTGWQSSLKFYYFASLAKTLPLLENDSALKFRQQLKSTLESAQAANGLWQNSSALMREDDPLIATSFAVMALGLIGEEN